MNDINQNIEQQPTTPTPEVSGAQGEKLFRQADLDRIISERLARERAKSEPSPTDERKQALKVREAKMDCLEYVAETGFPAELLEIFDTSDFEAFKATVERLDQIVSLPSTKRKLPYFTRPIGHGGTPAPSLDLRGAFGLD